MNRFQFVADHQRRFGVKRLCSILGIARSSFYYWRRTAADRAARQAADARLAARIRAVHFESDGTYGVPRFTAELRDDGWRVNHKRIARVMRSIGLAGVRLRRRHRTTVPEPAAAKAPDLIGRDFTAAKPNTRYVGDIIYLPLDGGKFLYLATSSSTSPHAAWSAGRSRIVCEPISSMPWPPPSGPVAASPARSCTPIAALLSTPAGRSPAPAAEPASASPGARSAPARTTHVPSPSTQPSSGRRSRDGKTGPASARPASTRSAGCTATTPDAVTPASGNAVRSPTRQRPEQHQLR